MLQHVIGGGIDRKRIFLDDADGDDLLDRVASLQERFRLARRGMGHR